MDYLNDQSKPEVSNILYLAMIHPASGLDPALRVVSCEPQGWEFVGEACCWNPGHVSGRWQVTAVLTHAAAIATCPADSPCKGPPQSRSGLVGIGGMSEIGTPDSKKYLAFSNC